MSVLSHIGSPELAFAFVLLLLILNIWGESKTKALGPFDAFMQAAGGILGIATLLRIALELLVRFFVFMQGGAR